MSARVSDVINLFFSSTADAVDFDRFACVSKACKNVETAKRTKINIIEWKRSVGSGVGKSKGQDVIDSAIGTDYDIYLGILGPKYGLGTIHEFEDAIKSHIGRGMPAQVMFGFDTTPVNPFTIPDNFKKVRQFKESLHDDKKYGRAILYYTFSGESEFVELTFNHIIRAVEIVHDRVSGGVII